MQNLITNHLSGTVSAVATNFLKRRDKEKWMWREHKLKRTSNTGNIVWIGTSKEAEKDAHETPGDA